MTDPQSPDDLPRLNLPSQWSIEGASLLHERQRVRVDIDTGLGVITDVSPARHRPGEHDGVADGTIVLPDGVFLSPGFIDLHVHCRDDVSGEHRYKETFATASRAAIQGGIVALADMPNNPVPPQNAESYAAKQALAKETGAVDIVLYALVAPGEKAFSDDVPYKCYYGPSIGNLHLQPTAGGENPLANYAGQFVTFHAESFEILEEYANAPTHEERRPAHAEAQAIDEIADLAEKYGFHAHIAHLSTRVGLEAIRRARQRGISMTTEVTSHHLYFDVENRHRVERGEWLQMNPPLRTKEDREVLREALQSGEIELFATDHAPHTIEENQSAISGVPLLDTFTGVLGWLESKGLSWETLVERASSTPARLFHRFLDGTYGTIDAGAVASLTVIDTREPWTVQREHLCSRAGWSPFEGVDLPARAGLTVVRGRAYRPHGSLLEVPV